MSQLTVLVVGSGGREHALIWKLAKSPRIGKLYAAPGNGGIGQLAENVSIPVNDIEAMVAFATSHHVDLTVVAPDDPLAAGMVDRFQAAGLRAFGPTAAATQIEASKVFSKQLMAKQHIPTARFKAFSDAEPALAYIRTQPLPIVVKASGLALGKGVVICQTLKEAEQAVTAIMSEKIFGTAGSEVVIEEFLVGPEISIHALTDGQEFVLLPPAQDHKPIYEHDTGPNTGGMGVIAPVPWVTDEQLAAIAEKIVTPALKGLAADRRTFVGCLYPGLAITDDGPQVIEFNARFGDPETQAYMRLLESDLLDLIDACLDRRIAQTKVVWKPGFAVCIALASGGYPGKYKKGLPITGLEAAAAQPDIVIFHAGTTFDDTTYRTAGGRVLGVSATGSTLQQALDKAYAAAELIHFDGMYYRRDIGAKSLT